VKCSEVKCSAVKGVKSGCTVKGIYGWWSEVKWSIVHRRGLNRGVPWRVFMVGEVKWSAVKGVKSGYNVKGIYGWWSEVKVLLKLVCYTCGLTTLETRYYMHFVLICTVVVSYCFVMCVCVCVCVCGFCNVCVCEGFVMCGCFGNMYTVLWLRFFLTWGFSYPDWGFSLLFSQL